MDLNNDGKLQSMGSFILKVCSVNMFTDFNIEWLHDIVNTTIFIFAMHRSTCFHYFIFPLDLPIDNSTK